MADPVALLKEFQLAGKTVELEGNNFNFDGILIPRDTETPFKTKKGQSYPLDAVWFVIQKSDLKHVEYFKLCSEKGFPSVSIVDKKEIIEYFASASRVEQPIALKRQSDSLDDRSDKKLAKIDSLEPDSGALGISEDKIAELRRKRESRKHGVSNNNNASSASDSLSGILNQEKPVATRNTILQTTKRPFTNIIEVVSYNSKSADEKRRIEHEKHIQEQKKKGGHYDRYGDVQEDRFWKDRLKGNDAEEFQIDTRGSNLAGGAPRPEVPRPRRDEPKNSSSPAKKPVEVKKFDKNSVPIIIVPAALTSLITLYNVKEFLENGVFIPSMDKKNAGVKKEPQVTVEKKREDNLPTKFQIIDNTTKLEQKDWNRVVAVFVIGATWQFKNWPWSTPLEIFNNIAGFNLQYDDEKISETIKGWNVKTLMVSKQIKKAHLASIAQINFWDQLDQAVSKRTK